MAAKDLAFSLFFYSLVLISSSLLYCSITIQTCFHILQFKNKPNKRYSLVLSSIWLLLHRQLSFKEFTLTISLSSSPRFFTYCANHVFPPQWLPHCPTHWVSVLTLLCFSAAFHCVTPSSLKRSPLRFLLFYALLVFSHSSDHFIIFSPFSFPDISNLILAKPKLTSFPKTFLPWSSPPQ